MDYKNLQVLLEVVDNGSIQGAARRMGLSRSLLRRRLAELEIDVGVPVLHRDSVGVRLTPAGRVVVDQGRALMESSRALLADARAAAEKPPDPRTRGAVEQIRAMVAGFAEE